MTNDLGKIMWICGDWEAGYLSDCSIHDTVEQALEACKDEGLEELTLTKIQVLEVREYEEKYVFEEQTIKRKIFSGEFEEKVSEK